MSTVLRRRRGVSPSGAHCGSCGQGMHLALGLHVSLESFHLVQSVLNIASHLRRENGAGIHRFWNRLLPRLQQTFHCLARRLIDF